MTIRARHLPALAIAFAVATILAFQFGVVSSSGAVSSTLHATVGPDFQIGLTFDDGTSVTSVPAGAYTVVVNDQGTNHNFHLFGAGVDNATSIESTEQVTWSVTFADGQLYQFHCDRHPGTLNGSFPSGNLTNQVTTTTATTTPVTVTPVATTTPVATAPTVTTQTATVPGGALGARLSKITNTSPPAEATFAGTLLATLSPSGKVSVSKSGKTVQSLSQGIYYLRIVDGTKRGTLTIRQVAGGKFHYTFTSAAFVGKKLTTISLGPGTWKVYSASSSRVLTVKG